MVRPISMEKDVAAAAATDADHGRAGGNRRVTRSRKQSSVDNSRKVDSAHGRGVPGSGSGGTSSNDDHHGRPLVNNESTAGEDTNDAVLDSTNKQTRKRPSSQLATDNQLTANETQPPRDHQSRASRKKKNKVEPLGCLSSHVKAEPKTDASVKKEEPEMVLSYVKTEAKVEDTDGNYSSTIKSGLGRDFSHVKKEDQVDRSVAMEELSNGDDSSTGNEMELAKKDSSINVEPQAQDSDSEVNLVNNDLKVEVVDLLDDDDDSVVELTADEFARGAAKKDMGNGDGSRSTASTSAASTAAVGKVSSFSLDTRHIGWYAARKVGKKRRCQRGKGFPGPSVDPQLRKPPPGMGNNQAQKAPARPSVASRQDNYGSKEVAVAYQDCKLLTLSSNSAHASQGSLLPTRHNQHQASSSLEFGRKVHAHGSKGGKVINHSSRNENGDIEDFNNGKDGALKPAARLLPADARISLAENPPPPNSIPESTSAIATNDRGMTRLLPFSPIRSTKEHESIHASGVPAAAVQKRPAASTRTEATVARITPTEVGIADDERVEHTAESVLENITGRHVSSDRTLSSKDRQLDANPDGNSAALGSTVFGQSDGTLQRATTTRNESDTLVENQSPSSSSGGPNAMTVDDALGQPQVLEPLQQVLNQLQPHREPQQQLQQPLQNQVQQLVQRQVQQLVFQLQQAVGLTPTLLAPATGPAPPVIVAPVSAPTLSLSAQASAPTPSLSAQASAPTHTQLPPAIGPAQGIVAPASTPTPAVGAPGSATSRALLAPVSAPTPALLAPASDPAPALLARVSAPAPAPTLEASLTVGSATSREEDEEKELDAAPDAVPDAELEEQQEPPQQQHHQQQAAGLGLGPAPAQLPPPPPAALAPAQLPPAPVAAGLAAMPAQDPIVPTTSDLASLQAAVDARLQTWNNARFLFHTEDEWKGAVQVAIDDFKRVASCPVVLNKIELETRTYLSTARLPTGIIRKSNMFEAKISPSGRNGVLVGSFSSSGKAVVVLQHVRDYLDSHSIKIGQGASMKINQDDSVSYHARIGISGFKSGHIASCNSLSEAHHVHFFTRDVYEHVRPMLQNHLLIEQRNIIFSSVARHVTRLFANVSASV